ncbi:serine/threonine protein kinase [Actinomadura craniellae]|uniref:Serine/threonine protein kinase n=1 Tax=Actinomadura craniellae TaxID=2231787 RepID=A0A365GZU8_9ACTN|nr:serine/threonine-protein kinase [Actinomadura craniellae]RAY12350.1 serine/threonine protein kinase [Actinomadura craniellae]
MKGVATSGERIGRYRLLETLGEGGMGVVHLGVDPEGRKVAIKVLRASVAADATALRRLAREVDSMRRVHSPNVAEIVDADVTAERPYIITQYVPGRTLEQAVEDDGPLSGTALQRLAAGLAKALSAIHGAGIIHRDLKPGNVMFLDGEPVVIDFGIAQGMDATRLTATGMVIGTPGYLAPEIIEGEDAGPPSDVHSWASTLVYAATGRPPFGSGTFESIFYKIMQGTPDLDGVPDALLPLIRTAMARNPAERPTAVKLVQLSRRLSLEATITDQTRIDTIRRVDRPAEGPQSMQMYAPAPPHPEPVPAQPRDFKGMLPPAAPPPPPAPAPAPPAPAPYERPHYEQQQRRPEYPPPPPPVPYDPYAPQEQYRPAPPPPEERRPDTRRAEERKPFGWYRLCSLAVLAGLLGLAALAPTVALLATLAGVLLLRIGDRAASKLESRRTRRGPSSGDVVGAVVRSPLAVPRALLTTTLLVPIGVLLGLAVVLTLAVMRPDTDTARALSYAVMAIVLLLSLGPGSVGPRRQLARFWGALLPRREPAMAMALVLGVLAVVLIGLAPEQEPDLRPLGEQSGTLRDVRGDLRSLLPW